MIETKIKKFAFEKDSIIFMILVVLLLATVRWYILEKEEAVSYKIASMLSKFSAESIGLYKGENEIPNGSFLKNEDSRYFKIIQVDNAKSLLLLGYKQSEADDVIEDLRYKNEVTRKVDLNETQYFDFVVKTKTDANNFWIIRVDVDLISEMINSKFKDIINLVILGGVLIYLSFVFVSSQLRAKNIESKERQLKLNKANLDLRIQQDEVLKRQTELIAANERYEIINKKLIEHTKDLEKNKTAMLNMLQDIEEARKEANRANNAKSVFLASMSHEIRTPMNGVLGMIDICLSTDLTDEQKDYLETAHGSGVTLMSLLNDILDFSKIEAGKLEVENAEFNLYRVIHDVSLLFRQKVYEKGVEILVEIDPNIPKSIIGDSTRVRQVLSNLIGNSAKFTEKGYILIRAYIEKEENGEKIQIEVSDTGIGMTPEQHKNLFMPFTQADASISRKFGGTGLGLTISKQLVKLMGGAIWAVSKEGKGSKFSVQLPLVPVSKEGFKISKKLSEKSYLLVISKESVLENVISYLKKFKIRYQCITDFEGFSEIEPASWDGCIFDSGIKDLEDYLRRLETIKASNPAFKIIGLFSYLERIYLKNLQSKFKIESLYKPIFLESLYEIILGVSVGIDDKKEKAKRFEGMAEKINKNMSILIAEDNLVNQKVINSYFSKLGFEHVTVVSNGQEALDEINKGKIDIVFMDIQMPVMDGLIATTKIRENEKKIGAKLRKPVIALTAHSYVGEQKRCFEAGMDDYLGKPIQLDRLILCLEKWSKVLFGEAPNEEENVDSDDKKSGSKDKEVIMSKLENNIDYTLFNLTKETLGDSFPEVIDVFINDCLEKIKEMDRAMNVNDKETVSMCAHQLKSSSGSFGILKLSEYAKNLEEYSKSSEYSVATGRSILSDIVSEFNIAKIFMYEQVSKSTGEK